MDTSPQYPYPIRIRMMPTTRDVMVALRRTMHIRFMSRFLRIRVSCVKLRVWKKKHTAMAYMMPSICGRSKNSDNGCATAENTIAKNSPKAPLNTNTVE